MRGAMNNIVMPMAGHGRRLEHLGHKPLIKIGGKTMVEWAVESLGIDGNYIFIIQQEFRDKLEPVLKGMKPDCIIIALDHVTNGAAETVLQAQTYIDNTDPLITVNCDQYLEWEPDKFLERAKGKSGCILTYTMSEGNGSFCILDNNGRIYEN